MAAAETALSHVDGEKGELIIAESGTGSVALVGGEMIETNSPIYIGLYGFGQLIVNNTTILTPEIMLGTYPGSAGQ